MINPIKNTFTVSTAKTRKSANLKTVKNQSPTNTISFKKRKEHLTSEVPYEWEIKDGIIRNNYGYSTIYDREDKKMYEHKEVSDGLEEYIQEHQNIPFYKTTTEHNGYGSYPTGQRYTYAGKVNLDENGHICLDEKCEELEERKSEIAKQLVEIGRDEEALQRYPEKANEINKINNAIKSRYDKDYSKSRDEALTKHLADGNFIEALKLGKMYFPKPIIYADEKTLKELDTILKDDEKLEQVSNAYLKNSFLETKGLFSNTDPDDRTAYALGTFGASELLNAIVKVFQTPAEYNKNKEYRKGLCFTLGNLFGTKNSKTNIQIDKSKELKDVEQKKEDVKNVLQSEFIVPLMQSKSNSNIELPNCIMLYGKNPHIMKEIIDWTADQTDLKYIKVPSIINEEEMQENIYNALEQAEENYKENGERSIIFVNGMDKLLLNYLDDLAVMKDIMGTADEDYHSTIMFYTTRPEELDKGTLASHRVGLKIEVPIDLDYTIIEEDFD